MEKILIGLGMEDAEKLLKEAIKRNNPDHIVCDDLITHKGREHILDKIKNNNPTVVILRESLKGNDDILQTIYLIKKHFNVRIIFIAKNRKPGDKLLATLVGYSVYDILMGTSIPIEGIARLVDQTNTFQDVYHLIPKPEDDDYDELIFEDEEKEIDDYDEEKSSRIRNPFGIIKRDKPNKTEEKVIDEEVEDDNLDIENIFKNAKPTKPKKLFGKDIEEYKDILLNEDDEEIKDYDNIEEGSDVENYDNIKKSPKTKRSMFKNKNEKENEELRAIIKEGSTSLDKQLRKFEEEMSIEEEKLNKEITLEDENGQERLKKLQEELKKVKKLNKEREKERRKREKEELAIAERQKKLEEEEKLEKQKKEKEAVDFERKIRERELDIKEEYAKRSGIVINGSILSTIWNKGKRLFIFLSVLLVGSLLLNLLMAYMQGRDLYTAFIQYSDFVINLFKIIITYLEKLFKELENVIKMLYIKIKNS
ncbi:hypothetical protein [Tissierella sp. Yu-01]|uniref:hypothetical protein n=1 Tax=Tissierella sp. Yu-01 TaxID=3035694 RepID=UPI00240D3631|nr:hypothetical protein [Tissierella sp. Yu-01]WFA09579.1 hypothetical protein P3962_03225 [Tissierella sp. Yu-01]